MLARFEESVPEGEPHQLGAILEAELDHGARLVGFDRLEAKEEHISHLLARMPQRDKSQHFALAVAEGRVVGFGVILASRISVQKLADQHLGQRRVEEDLASGNGADGRDELGVGGFLQCIARSSCAKS